MTAFISRLSLRIAESSSLGGGVTGICATPPQITAGDWDFQLAAWAWPAPRAIWYDWGFPRAKRPRPDRSYHRCRADQDVAGPSPRPVPPLLHRGLGTHPVL